MASAPSGSYYPHFTEDEPEAQESSHQGVEPGVSGHGGHALTMTWATFQGHGGV